MFCRNCGQELADKVAFCPHCGTQVGEIDVNPQYVGNEQGNGQNNGQTCVNQHAPVQNNGLKSNVLAVIGFVLSFFVPVVGVPIAGLICSIIGFGKAKNEGADRKGLALAGIIVGAVCSALQIIIGIVEYSTIMDYIYGYYYYGYAYSVALNLPILI